MVVRPIVIRMLTYEDTNQIIELERLCFEYPLGERTIQTYMEMLDQISVGAFQNGRLIGLVLGVVENDSLHIVMVAVHPLYRRQGIASTLMEKTENLALARDIKYFTLEVDVFNSSAIKLCQKLGYRITRIIERYYENGNDAFLMTKRAGQEFA